MRNTPSFTLRLKTEKERSVVVIGDTIERVRDPPSKFSDKASNDDLSSINENLFANDKEKKRHVDNDSPISLQVRFLLQ